MDSADFDPNRPRPSAAANPPEFDPNRPSAAANPPPNRLSAAPEFDPPPNRLSAAPEFDPPPPEFDPIDSRGNRPAVRITTEFDSESTVFFHKISCKFIDSLAKLKLGFHNNSKGEIAEPQISFISKYLTLHYDLEDHTTLVNTSIDVGPKLKLTAAHDFKAQQGDLTILANLNKPGYALQLSTPIPSTPLFPKATFLFPQGEISLQDKNHHHHQEEQVTNSLSLTGNLKAHFLKGLCTAQYKDQQFNLRYRYKDDEMSFLPLLSLPSNHISFAFKRRFGPSNKLSYWYDCDSNDWSAVYKHTYGQDFKFKAGYDSEVRLGWASLWVGDEGGKAKTAPMKMKVQFMLQVPQDDIKSSALMFRVKKRWDI